MAITSSAKKALRASRRRRVFNKRRKDAFMDAVKRVRKFITDKNANEALKHMSAAYQAIDKAVKTNVINKNAAARKKSRLAKLVKNASK